MLGHGTGLDFLSFNQPCSWGLGPSVPWNHTYVLERKLTGTLRVSSLAHAKKVSIFLYYKRGGHPPKICRPLLVWSVRYEAPAYLYENQVIPLIQDSGGDGHHRCGHPLPVHLDWGRRGWPVSSPAGCTSWWAVSSTWSPYGGADRGQQKTADKMNYTF